MNLLKRSIRLTFCTMAFLAFFLAPVSAQDSLQSDSAASNQQAKVDSILGQMQQEMQGQQSQSTTIPDSIISPPTAVQQQVLNDSTLAMYQDAMYAYYEYRVSGFNHRKEVFAWQLFSTKLIFWCVLFLVFSGICFSAIQFYKSLRREPVEGAAPPPESVTEFEASAKGLKITSPVLGVIILVISLVFFYLYLVYVYPISEIF